MECWIAGTRCPPVQKLSLTRKHKNNLTLVHPYFMIYIQITEKTNLTLVRPYFMIYIYIYIHTHTHTQITEKTNLTLVRAQGSGLWPLPCWDRGFDSHRGHGYFVCCECRVLSGRGLCDELITRPEESYRLCCVVMCDLETSRICAPYIYIYMTLVA